MDYGKTLNLPKTSFPMKANLAVKELGVLKKWDEFDLYNKVLEKNADKPSFVMHDGPPYANGHLHDGHILNKLLKDITVKYKNMSGFKAPFTPGWDCHGLPIELKVADKLGSKRHQMSTVDILKECRNFALKAVNIQKDEFKRLGVSADWENPYLTLTPEYEGKIAHQFANIIESGALFKSKKPVHWCPSCETALAEAEVEYDDHKSPSIYVKFPLTDKIEELGDEKVNFVIWTTTPWTIPSNLAIALNKDLEYAALRFRGELFIVAYELKDTFLAAIGQEEAEVVKTFNATRFEGMKTKHPFIDRESIIIYGSHVTLEAGTGCVHTAPGHGQDDYVIGMQYGLDAYAPVDGRGCFTDEVERWAGRHVHKVNREIVEFLFETGFLLNKPGEDIEHSYPHCWRCHKPIIFRATEQWFISMDDTGLRTNVQQELKKVEFIPSWGESRITAMIDNAPNWCISRQRLWGVPIIAFSCKDCEEKIVDAEIAHTVADMFSEHGIEIWHKHETSYFLPEGFKCPKCGGTHIEKEKDILDVWFDSGVSWAAVLNDKAGYEFPADLYLEGSDQHRGWFQSSLKLSTLIKKQAPYKKVLTHGFVVDGKGEKLSKSKGNFTPPDKRIKKLGAEIMRLWVCAEDYRDDIRISDDIIATFTTAYRKIRNTIRFMFGFINDFDPVAESVKEENLTSIDKYALTLWKERLNMITERYESFEYHRIYHDILDFFTVGMSSFYLDVIKDRYVMRADDPTRKMSQSVVFEILSDIVKVLAPVLSFTAEEAYSYLPGDKKETVFFEDFPKRELTDNDKKSLQEWKKLIAVREGVQKLLEELRANKTIGHSLDAKVTLYWENIDILSNEEKNLESLFIISGFEKAGSKDGLIKISDDFEAYAKVEIAAGDKCQRCWKKRELKDYSEDISGICPGCYEVVK